MLKSPPPGGFPTGTLVNPFIAITAEARPNANCTTTPNHCRASQSNPDVNGNITNTWSYDWDTILHEHKRLGDQRIGHAIANERHGLQRAVDRSVYWNPSPQYSVRLAIAAKSAGNHFPSSKWVDHEFFERYLYLRQCATTANVISYSLAGPWQDFSILQLFPNGNVESQTDPNGNMTVTCYNGSYNLYPKRPSSRPHLVPPVQIRPRAP